ncbi:FecR domain-containing protein [Porticoccaceae bacterium]|nr:FecR domain-containing protein [Porticoccaceae bacterium]
MKKKTRGSTSTKKVNNKACTPEQKVQEATKASSTMDNCIVAPFPNQSAIKQEAGAWIVKIDSAPLNAKEAAELQRWMAQSDFHKQYLEKLAKNWDAMGILQELSALFPINTTPLSWAERLKQWMSGLSSPNQSSPNQSPLKESQNPWPRNAFAASALVLMAALYIFNQPQTHFETAIGQQATYQLADGTTISLNTNSEADIEYSAERRVVRLHRGEASFDVAKNPERPFMVYAGEGMVWAVGTAFNVRYQTNPSNEKQSKQQPHSIDVIVTEGTIKVYAGISNPALVAEPSQPTVQANTQGQTDTQSQNKKVQNKKVQNKKAPQKQAPKKEVLANAGTAISYSQTINSIDQATQLQLDKQQAWQQGSLLFKGETLEQALQEISRYTTKQIIITDSDIKNIRVGGHYKTHDIGALLAALSEGFGIQVTQVSKGRIELSRKAGTNTPKNE